LKNTPAFDPKPIPVTCTGLDASNEVSHLA
jgi:hypothetical protein